MSNSSEIGTAWLCGVCQSWIPWSQYHSCGTSPPTIQSAEVFALQRLAAAAERIAAALEAKETTS